MTKLQARLARVGVFVAAATAIYFYWGTTWYTPGAQPAGHFPVVLQTSQGKPPRYALYRWQELQELLQREPALSLTLPVGERRIELDREQGFTPTVYFRVEKIAGGQRIEVTHHTDDYLFQGTYRVAGNVIEAERFRTGHGMMVMGAVFLGGMATVMLGWLFALARWLSKHRSVPAAE